MNNREFYLFVGVNDVPWDRIQHWYGRASNFPTLFKQLLSKDEVVQKEAIDEIKNKIEHQDGVIMATPFTLLFLFRVLTIDKKKIEKILNDILDTILVSLQAAKFQMDNYESISNKMITIYELLSEKHLLPAFESEEQDEIIWEEYDYSEEWYYWSYYTIHIAQSFISIIDPLCMNKFYIEKARKIRMLADPPKNYL